MAALDGNGRAVLEARRASGALRWPVVAALLPARMAFAVLAHGATAGLFALQGSQTPWRDAAPWFPIFATLIDLGCLVALKLAMRREGGRLLDLVGFDRTRLLRDAVLGVLLIAPSLLFILGGTALAGLIAFGRIAMPTMMAPLPLWPAVYAILIFPLLWGVVEQMTYAGYAAARLQVLTGRAALAACIVAIPWSLQHAVMPLAFEADYALYRALSGIPFSIFAVLVYLRIRTIVPLAVAHWLLDGATVVIGALAPLWR